MQAFRDNFTHREELGAAVAIYHHNKLVVDLWGGGIADKASGAPWRADTLTLMMSVAKGISTLCVAMLVDRGLVSLDEPLSVYWPEFAAEGKGTITVQEALGHLAGIPVTDLAALGDFYYWERMTSAIAQQKPLWRLARNRFITLRRWALSRASWCAVSQAAALAPFFKRKCVVRGASTISSA